MKTITAAKDFSEILSFLKNCKTVYLTGCGTCATLCHTGGKSEVTSMKEKLEAEGKTVAGWMVIPTSCDDLTRDAVRASAKEIERADCVLAMTCSTGVQTLAFYLKEETGKEKPVYPALNTLFLGVEESPGQFKELCLYCGNCVIGRTATICPLVRCAKSLLNGPCGGSSKGKCEISPDIPCAWQMIYDRLVAMGRAEEMNDIIPAKDWSTAVSGGPRKANVESECGLIIEKSAPSAK